MQSRIARALGNDIRRDQRSGEREHEQNEQQDSGGKQQPITQRALGRALRFARLRET